MSEGPVINAEVVAAGKRVRRVRAWQMIGLSVLLFVSGGVSGWAVSRFGHGGPRDGLMTNGGGMDRPDPPVGEIVDRMRGELRLSDEQVEKVKGIYAKRFEALKAVRDAMKPKMTTEYEGLKADMKGVLSEGQFGEWDKRFENVRNRMLPPPPPPRDGRGGDGRDGRGPPGMGGPGGGGRDGPPPDGPGGGDGPPGGGGGPRGGGPPRGAAGWVSFFYHGGTEGTEVHREGEGGERGPFEGEEIFEMGGLWIGIEGAL